MDGMSIVIPAKNAENTIEPLLRDLLKSFPKSEIIVICNNCTDRTYEVVNGIKSKNIINVNIPRRIGKGGAILAGLKLASRDIVGFADADWSFDSNDVKEVSRWVGDYDCAIASKWKGKKFGRVNWPLRRKLLGRVWNSFVKFLLHLSIEDTQAGLKFFKKKVYKSMDKNFLCRGFDFDVEFLYKVHKMGFSIKEVFVEPRIEAKSTFSMFEIPEMLLRLLILPFRN